MLFSSSSEEDQSESDGIQDSSEEEKESLEQN
jgi:hypothetical protein